ncbi:hypothetical protein EGR_07226 [Echinococcus granulosus]|uniref:Uncharacterized protein n=1 Tax=Echinococcus granulosus TaxID=6210 RepID=W6UWK9_ECHGR|nr:hypothetical protein EGR_07226 [Echinococcus granulosus]EUB57864.1 hypothetical protein EGR_07226 [Echinococcus granulosus]
MVRPGGGRDANKDPAPNADEDEGAGRDGIETADANGQNLDLFALEFDGSTSPSNTTGSADSNSYFLHTEAKHLSSLSLPQWTTPYPSRLHHRPHHSSLTMALQEVPPFIHDNLPLAQDLIHVIILTHASSIMPNSLLTRTSCSLLHHRHHLAIDAPQSSD